MMLRTIPIFLIFILGCIQYSLSVKKESVNRESLASTFVGSPDPRQANPPFGQQLIIGWRVPKNPRDLKLVLHVLYKNYEQEVLEFPIVKRRGMEIYSLQGARYAETKGFLTYKAEIQNEEGEVLDLWKQQLWVELISLDQENIPLEFE